VNFFVSHANTNEDIKYLCMGLNYHWPVFSPGFPAKRGNRLAKISQKNFKIQNSLHKTFMEVKEEKLFIMI